MAILTVYTKLLDKTLEGARIIDMGSTKTCQCFVLPYDTVAKVGKEYLAGKYAFYILLGHRAIGGPCAYIGQTNDFTNRVTDHKQKKDWWDDDEEIYDEYYSTEKYNSDVEKAWAEHEKMGL